MSEPSTVEPPQPSVEQSVERSGSFDVDIDAELAQLGPTGYRPLQVRDTLL